MATERLMTRGNGANAPCPTRAGQTRAQLQVENADLRAEVARLQELLAAHDDGRDPQAQEALRLSEERLRAQYKGNPIPIYVWRSIAEADDWALVDYNDAAEAITRGAIRSFLGRSARDLYRARPDVLDGFVRCWTDRTNIRQDWSAPLATTGEHKEMDVTFVFVPPDQVMVHTEDVTTRKRAEQAHRESEQRLRTVVDHAPIALFALDRHAIFTTSIGGAYTGVGIDPATRVGRSAYDLYADRPDIIAHFHRALAGEEHRTLVELNGAIFENRWLPLRDESGTVTEVIGIAVNVTERARAEEDRRASEERYRRIVETAQEGIWEIDAAGRTTYVNRRMADLLGYTPDEMEGQPISAYLDAIERAAVRARLERHRQTGVETDRYEMCLRRKDGAALWTLVAVTVLPDGRGRHAGSVAMVTDISERRRAEELNARLAAIVASSDDAILGKTLDGIVTSWNAGAERLYGYAAHEAVGRSIAFLIPADHPDELPSIMERLKRGERLNAYEAVRVHRDGHKLDVVLSISPIKDAAGTIIGAATIARDISERKRGEKALQARARQQAAIAALGLQVMAESDLTAVFDRAVRVVAETLHVEYCDLLELASASHEALLQAGVGWREGLVGRATVDCGLESLGGYTLAASEPVMVDDLRAETRFSGPPLLHAHGVVSGLSVVINSASGPFGMLGAHSTARRRFTQDDVHFMQAVANLLSTALERARAEEARRRSAELEEQNRCIDEASRLKSDFLANMSHELRTPLNAIMGFTELLHDGKIGPVAPEQKEFMGDILTSSRHLLQLINDVLDLSKVEAGKTEFRPEPVDPAQLVAEVCAIVRTLAARKRLRLSMEIDPVLGPLALDPARLKQVLYNYLSNAIKFSHIGGTIAISVTAEGADRFRLEVRDTGIGISPADQAQLFTEFAQLEAGKAAPDGGAGLGLALTRRIVEAQGGHVGVTSAVGAGSLFYAVLPRIAETT